jgi:hypothetical protein
VFDARVTALRRLVSDLGEFSRACYPGRSLRQYQLEACEPVLDVVRRGVGGSFVWLFSRQAGKDEALAQLLAFLAVRFKLEGGSVVLATPTFKPQAIISRRRLVERMGTALHPGVVMTQGYRVVCGGFGVSFMTTDPKANARGETADRLLVANEAQDTTVERWDSVFAPMGASTNAPLLVMGTPWVAGSLLSRETAIAKEKGRLIRADWRGVAEEVPAYGEYVKGQIAKLGETHPFIKTEYELDELGSEGGLFPASRRAQMQGEHVRRRKAESSRQYALLVDIAGEDEDAPDDVGARGREKRRDSTALTVVEVDLVGVKDPMVARPCYRVVDRAEWVGVKHTILYQKLLDLARNVWKARWIVVDATGVGAGLASFLGSAVAGSRCEVIPFVFSLKSKSDLGWGFLGVVDSGRYKEYSADGEVETGRFWAQVEGCEYTVDVGPGKIMRWSVPESKGHDDLLISASLVGVLDGLDLRPRMVSGRTREDWR